MLKIKLEKLRESDNPLYPNNIPEGWSREFLTNENDWNKPKLGERAYFGRNFSTSGVLEIIDENTFRTYNSIYRYETTEIKILVWLDPYKSPFSEENKDIWRDYIVEEENIIWLKDVDSLVTFFSLKGVPEYLYIDKNSQQNQLDYYGNFFRHMKSVTVIKLIENFCKFKELDLPKFL